MNRCIYCGARCGSRRTCHAHSDVPKYDPMMLLERLPESVPPKRETRRLPDGRWL